MKKTIVMLGILVALMGCSSGRADQPGPAIDVYPVYATLALQTDRQQQAKAQTRLEEFLREQHSVLVTQQIVLYWSTSHGERFAENTMQKLRTLGVAPEHVRMEKLPAGFGQHFDFQMEILSHHVVVPICPYAQVSRFGQEGSGCFTESLRWQSMVNPHNMLQPANQIQRGE
ncbi:hypothetical protein ACXHPE_01885 [Vibrio cincinnatiensis]|jgi:hypothetical protein|uniref:Uncharacterized protein n=1 Tax=Vibrio cincinnatiensis DSM 19608 TaxID=1123491 RepID=A0A1T4L0K8_VIBCI|nr:hypothetical protein [Vibrio cincinnatiensis]MCG3725520.1 hypothetical protein [Vibrio cincinnatiensis]MCG3736044.1 hypothetical protein [Vibrio cincinnatiensis]SJZ48272.1 hypothetical protein SAMN02745782_00420 [Vibrio cincinnatiensis DSM 19608]SUP48277.1 lipoprotein [Vibrio cincinnatiensis]